MGIPDSTHFRGDSGHASRGRYRVLDAPLTPGDPAAKIAGDAATSQDIAQLRTELGLDRPLPIQFGIWIGDMLTGDFGESFYYKRPVSSMIADGVEPTVSLAIFTMVLACFIAVPLGTWAAYRQGSWIDRAVMGFSVVGFSVPVFVIGYILVYVFSVQLDWFPVQGYQPHWGRHRRLGLSPDTALPRSVSYLCSADWTHNSYKRARGLERRLRPHCPRERSITA